MKYRSHFTESIEFFDFKKNETRTVNIYYPFEELEFGVNFETKSGSFGYYTIKLTNDLKF